MAVSQERGTERHTYHLSCNVITVQEDRINLLLASSDGWAFVCGMDPRTVQLRDVFPATIGYTAKGGRYVAIERTKFAVEANPSLVTFPDYPLVGLLLLGFPSEAAAPGKLLAIHESEEDGGKPTIEEAPLAQKTGVQNGILTVTLESAVRGAAVRLVTEWEPGLPWFRYAEFEDGLSGTRGHVRLLSYGDRTSQFYEERGEECFVSRGKLLDGTAKDRVTALEQGYPPESDVNDRVGDELVRLAEAELAPRAAGVRLQPAGDEDLHRGDVLDIEWNLRRFVMVGDRPKTTRWVIIPTTGRLAMRVQDVRRVGREELVFLQVRGCDAADYVYRLGPRWLQCWEGRRDKEVPAWSLATKQGIPIWATREYWLPAKNGATWVWDRVRQLKKMTPRSTSVPRRGGSSCCDARTCRSARPSARPSTNATGRGRSR